MSKIQNFIIFISLVLFTVFINPSYCYADNNLNISFEEVEFDFQEDKYEYNLDVDFEIRELTPHITFNNQGASYESINNDKIIVGYNKVTIKVNNKNYIFNVTRKSSGIPIYQTFNYTGNYQTFKAPKTGKYKIELWGARGGNISSYYGGYGAYTSGNIELEENDILYIYIGGSGSESSIYGGYNGGGDVGAENQIRFGRSGGGATDVRLTNGTWNDFNSLKSRIMVAAGGGGANFRSEGYGEGNGGAAGGLIGYDGTTINSSNNYGRGFATGGTQNSGGTFTWVGTYTSPNIPGGSFGIGGGSTVANAQGGGGGGYYGGSGNQHGGAGGGSSFISGHDGSNAILNTSTSSNIVHTNSNIHYSGKKFTNTVMIDGNGYSWADVKKDLMLMPNPSGNYFASGKGNDTNGAARISIVNPDDDNSYLANIILSAGTINFDKETNNYEIELTEDDTDLEIRAIPENIDAAVNGNGTYEIVPGTNSIEITVTALDGSIRIYTLKISRTISSNPYLKGILINGESLKDFKEDVLEYDVVLPYNVNDVNVEGILANKNQTLSGEGVHVLTENKVTAKLFVVSEDKNANKLYTINFTKDKSTLLHKITFNDINLELVLENNKFNYEIDVSKTIHSLEDLNIEPYYYGVQLDVTGNKYLGERNNTINIVASLDGLADSTYTIKVNFKNDVAIEVNDYSCKGDFQTFVVPSTGSYKIELWGARGGNISKYLGGKGAYTSGSINLTKNEILYIYVGCAGPENSVYGGYNGGGHVGILDNQLQFGRAGGGATDIRLVSGAWDSFDSLKSRIMVAAGGGGANFRSYGYGEGNGGAGGGIVGYTGETTNSTSSYGRGTATGGTQTSGGKFSWRGVQPSPRISDGSFGYGGGNVNVRSQGGGGGGYYGGAGNQHGGAGGGSSFISGHNGSNAIAESSTVSNIIHTGDSVHYSGKEFKDTLMIDGNGYNWTDTKGSLMLMPNPNGGYYNSGVGNSGNGFARISTLETLPNDNFLESLELSSNGKNITIDFEPWTLEYSVNLTDKETKLDISAIPMDLKASVAGTGTIEVAPGDSTHDIIVTAQDGSIKTYTININRTPSSDAEVLNIELKRLSKNLCKLNANYCVYEFNSSVLSYDIFLPYNTKEIEFNPVLKSKWQTIEYKLDDEVVDTNIVNLTKETTKFEIKIISEDKEHSTTYVYNLTRDMTGNNNLVNITITNPDIEISDFSANTYEYYLTLPKGYDSYDVDVETEGAKATYEITGNTNLKFGMNDCYITVTAENGDSKMYILHMYKEYEENVLLDYLKVYNGVNSLELLPNFDNKINEYELKVDKDISKIRIDAAPLDTKASVTGIGEKTLEPGLNTFEINVTIGSVVNTYVINVFKERDNNPNVKNITIDGYSLDKEFDKDELEYYVYLNKNETSLQIDVEMESTKATYTIDGKDNLVKNINEITITGIAEDKTTKVYKIYAVKEISNNNYLANLEYKTENNFVVVPNFDKDTLEYTLDIPSDVSKIEIKATPEDMNAIVEGNGTYYLDIGKNELIIKVTSEQLETREYKIIIDRPLSDDVLLKDVLNNRGSEVTKVENVSLGYDYLINVQNDITSIEIIGIPNASTSRVIGNRVYNLNTGENDITLTVKSASGKTKDYIVRVVRDKSSNDDLDFLYVEEGGLDPHFNETTIFYDVKVPNNINTLHIEAITEDVNATYEVIGGVSLDNGKYTYDISNFEVDTPQFIEVVVTAEDGTTKKTYTLSVMRQALKQEDEDLTLFTLTTNRGLLNPLFDKNILNYELEVENDITDITISATASSEQTSVIGTGTYNLKVGKNAISVFVIGKSGVQQDYQIIVTRKKSSDATLASLVVKGSTLSPKFSSDIINYSLKTSSTNLEFTTIKPSEVDATYEVIGNENFVTGENNVTIRVTAPDGITIKDYILTVTKEASKNNNLASLSVEDYELEPTFHKVVTFYTIEANNDSHNILITAVAEDENATIEGTGLKEINVGENYFDIIVTSEFGNKKIYTILVTKEASDNNYLSSLITSEGVLNPTFDKLVNDYSVEVNYDIEEITLNGTTEDSLAVISGIGNYKLDYGENIISIIVTSESGKVNTYTLTINRAALVSPYLKSLEVKDYTLDPEFTKENLEYYIDVNNEVTSLDITYVPEENNATVVINGNENFKVGMNQVEISVTSSIGENIKYIIYVNRQMSTNNYLNTLMVSDGDLNPDFNKQTLTYNVTVENINEIEVFATTEDENAKITKGLGVHTINYGENTIEINVRSQKGLIRTYKIIVTKNKSNNSKLGNILVKNINGDVVHADKEFNKDVNEYTYDLTERLDYITISTYLGDEFQTVSGDGIKELSAGKNIFEVVVTAGDGTINTYTLTVNNPESSNNYALSIIPSSGTLNPEFNKETLNYTLDLESNVNTLAFDVTLEDKNASVTGYDMKSVDEGTSVRKIIVRAEDGTEREYVITINKKSDAEARLKSLTIDNYPFEFNSDTFTYNIAVSKSKKILLESEITAIAKDSEATINMMGDLNLTDGIVNIYTIEVIAKDGYTTQTYTLNVTRDSEEYTIRTNKYEIVRFEDETNEDYVIGIQPSTLISDFKDNFENPAEDLKVYLETSEVQETDLTATAFVLKLEKNGYVYDTLRVIVRGDLTKDGKVNITDQVKMINYVGRTTTFDKYQMLAGDLTFDGKVNITDQVKIINYVGRTISDLNNKPTS